LLLSLIIAFKFQQTSVGITTMQKRGGSLILAWLLIFTDTSCVKSKHSKASNLFAYSSSTKNILVLEKYILMFLQRCQVFN